MSQIVWDRHWKVTLENKSCVCFYFVKFKVSSSWEKKKCYTLFCCRNYDIGCLSAQRTADVPIHELPNHNILHCLFTSLKTNKQTKFSWLVPHLTKTLRKIHNLVRPGCEQPPFDLLNVHQQRARWLPVCPTCFGHLKSH